MSRQTNLTSPWLHQLKRVRPVEPAKKPRPADVVIVGAGIAGISTAYYTLKHTRKSVLVIDGSKVSHAATGNNAGQLVSYFEKSFHEIVYDFGLELAGEGQAAIDSSWKMLDEIRKDMRLQTPLYTFMGFAGMVDSAEINSHLLDNLLKQEAKLTVETLFVSKTFREKIPRKFRGLYQQVEHKKILEMLETKDTHYIAALSGKKGCMNSAQFCEELITKLLKKYPKRLQLIENVFVDVLHLGSEDVLLKTQKFSFTCKKAVLCTNGFERIRIENNAGPDIDTKFHHLVRGSVGYMAAFLESSKEKPAAISYLPTHMTGASGAYDTDPYYYITRRPVDENNSNAKLVCVGGPEALMDDTNRYSREHPYPKEAHKLIDTFLKKTHPSYVDNLEYAYQWYGLMGYTRNGIRCVGEEPCNHNLLYNLGCNGIGILPSIYSGWRISQILKGLSLPPSIFDPQDQRCDDIPNHANQGIRLALFVFCVAWTLLTILAIFAALAQ